MRSNGIPAIGRAGADEIVKITLTLSTDERIALRRYARDIGEDLDAAAHLSIREFLIGVGMLELPESDNDNEDAV